MAETRTIRTVLELNAQRFTAGAAAASASAKNLSGELAKISDSSGKFRADYDRVGSTLLGFGAAAATGLGLATKASMDWESSWAGVTKTVDGTPEQLKAVEDGLRGLAKELPASHQEIAAVAEAAGQLGVETDSVVEFTRTMIDLGETTNLSAEEAATSLARFSNVMGTSTGDVDRLGSTIVGLGNNFETTESEILAMGMRISGIGAQMNLSEGDVLGMAAAMSSVGIEAEAGGTAMTMGMKKIQSAVDEGGESLEGFAEVAGMSTDEFSKLWQDDTAAGLEAFVHGLARVGEEGGNMSATLDDLGIKGIRESDTFLRLASNADGFSEAIAQGNTEFERNIALTAEAAQRYKTTESQMKMASNAIVDAGIDIGAVVLPLLAEVSGVIADVAGAFGKLPGPVQESIVVLGSIAGAAALLGGGLMKAVPAVTETIGAFRRLQDTAPGTASAIGKVGKAVGIATAAFTAVSLISAYGDSLTDFALSAEEAAEKALKLKDSSNAFDTMFEGMGFGADLASASTEELADNLDVLANGHWYEGISNLETGLRNAFTGADAATTDDLKQRLGEVGQSIAALAQNDLPAAQDAFTAMWEQAGGSDQAGQDLLNLMPELKSELTALANGANLATDDMTLLGIATGQVEVPLTAAETAMEGYVGAQGESGAATAEATGEVEEQVSALEALQGLLEGTANALLGVRGAQRDFHSAIDETNALIEENGRVLDENGKAIDSHSEKGRASEAALDGLATSTHGLISEMTDANATAGELDAAMTEGRDAFIAAAEGMGLSEEAAIRLADEMQLIPDFKEIKVSAETEQAKQDLASVTAAIEAAGGTIEINGETYEAEDALAYLMAQIEEGEGEVTINGETYQAEEAVAAFVDSVINNPDAEVQVDADTGPARMQFDGLLQDTPDATIDTDANTGPARDDVNAFTDDVDNTEAWVDVKADTVYAENQARDFQATVNDMGGTVTINGETSTAQQTFETLMAEIDAGEGYVNINGTTVDAGTALVQLTSMIDSSEGTVTIDGNAVPAYFKTDQAKAKADNTTGTIDVDANTAGAESGITHTSRDRDTNIDAHASTGGAEGDLSYTSRDRSTTVTAQAATGAASAAINAMTYTRTAYINVIARSVGNAVRVASGQANGGWVNEGLSSGGWVPGEYPGPGVDNVMWPVVSGKAGGGMLSQPLAGNEYVVNGASAQQWGPALEAINAGMSPTVTMPGPAPVDSGSIAAAVAAGMRGMTVALNLDGRTLHGAVIDAGKSVRQPFITGKA